jgi:hypothetical protein
VQSARADYEREEIRRFDSGDAYKGKRKMEEGAEDETD